MRYVRQKLVQLVIVVLAVTMLTFILMSLLPGRREFAIGGIGGSPEYYEQIRQQWGLDRPLPVQYLTWLGNMLTGDLGTSSTFNVPVTDLIQNRLPVSLTLMVYAIVVAMAIAVPLGVLTAYRANSGLDRTLNTAAFGLLSVPNYVLGVLLVFVFAVNLGWFPAISRYVAFWDDPAEHVKQFFLPVMTLAVGLIAIYMRLLRSDMVATLQNDFITLARSKGMSTGHILFRHALRPSTFALITAAAVNIGGLIGGTVVVETIFGLPGMGTLVVEAIFRRDFLVVQTCVVIFAVAFVFINFLVDLIYAAIDPRIRHARALA